MTLFTNLLTAGRLLKHLVVKRIEIVILKKQYVSMTTGALSMRAINSMHIYTMWYTVQLLL